MRAVTIEQIRELREFAATARQREVLDALVRCGSHRKAAAELGVTKNVISQAVKAAKTHAARQGWAPEHGLQVPYPDGFKMGKVTIQRDSGGNVERVWERMQEDRERQAAILRDAVQAAAEAIPRERHLPKAPKRQDADLLSLYVITDYHLGMLSWPEETGEAWDTGIAEDMLVRWFCAAVRQAPPAEQAVFAQLGDFLHWDGLDSVTPTSGHILDADTRFQQLVRVAIRALRRIVRLLLSRHQRVHLVMAEGNHDMASSVWLREMFAQLYEGEPRVSVDRSADVYYCYEWGHTSLFFHHGHLRRPGDIAHVFAAKYRDVFGRTKHSYAHMGHLHHIDVKENNLMTVEQHRTLASKDAYASRLGYMTGRDAKVITYHRRHGEVGRLVLSPDMVGQEGK